MICALNAFARVRYDITMKKTFKFGHWMNLNVFFFILMSFLRFWFQKLDGEVLEMVVGHLLSGHLLPPIFGQLLPLFWDICSPYFRTFAHRTFAHRTFATPFFGTFAPCHNFAAEPRQKWKWIWKNVFGVLTFRRKITLWTLTTYTISSRWVPFQETMALAVDQIIAQLQGEDDDVDEDMDGDVGENLPLLLYS